MDKRITPGKLYMDGPIVRCEDGRSFMALVSYSADRVEQKQSALLMLKAHNTANELYDLGYDPFVVLENIADHIAGLGKLGDERKAAGDHPEAQEIRALLTTLTREGGE